MKFKVLFFVLIIGFASLAFVLDVNYLRSVGERSFNSEVEKYLVSIISVNKERISDFVFEAESDVKFLSGSDKVRDVLAKDIVMSDEAAVLDVGGKINIIAREVENYLRAHPNMMLSDLQSNEEFYDVAVQDIGETGYSVLFDAQTGMVLFHPDSDLLGVSVDDLRKLSVNLGNIIDEAIEVGESNGFYDWEDNDGKVRRKYIEMKKVGFETGDGVDLISGVTAYVDDYFIADNVSEELREFFVEFNNKRDCHNILFISGDDRVIYMSHFMESVGVDVKVARSGVGEAYFVMENLGIGEVGFYGPFLGHLGSKSLQLAIGSKVYDSGKFVGTIIVIKDLSKINDILKEEKSVMVGEGDEDYLVNGDGILLTPLRERNVDVMLQEVDIESVARCLDSLEGRGQIEEDEKGDIIPFLDFKGDLIFGLERPISKVDWCLLSEVSAEGVLYEPLRKDFRKNVFIRAGLLGMFFVIIGGISFFISGKYVLKRRVWKNKIFSKKVEKFFRRLEFRYSFLFGLIFVFGCFFLITSFFQSYQNAAFYDEISDLSAVFVLILFAFYSFKLKKYSARTFIFLGSFLAIVDKLIQIVLEEYVYEFGVISSWYWIPGAIVGFVGLILILYGFREVAKC